MNKNGFTLIELLATIVILGVVLAIAIPTITGVIENTRKKSFEADAQMVMKAIDYQKLKDENFDVTTIDKNTVASILDLSNINYQTVTVTVENEIPSITIVGQNKWDGLVAHGTLKNMVVDSNEEYGLDETPPVITLNGEMEVLLEEGDEYNDAGATAVDDVDGDITDNIVVTSNVNVNKVGTYMIIYTVEDEAGNDAIPIGRVVRVLDTTIPVITLLGDNPVSIMEGSVYEDEGATALDDEDGDITADIVITSTVNPNVVGSYTVTYNVSDSTGNDAIPVTRTVNVVSSTYTYDFTGSIQTFTVPLDGTYQIECWGAQGGVNGKNGQGGYTKGNIELSKSTTLYLYIGGQGSKPTGGWNGGGAGIVKGDYTSNGGGGATDIRLINGNWNDTTSLRSRIMVAAGGGGADYVEGSLGGGLIGENGIKEDRTLDIYQGKGGTQIAGGAAPTQHSCASSNGLPGSFGIGGAGGASSNNGGGSGGGAGYYGGSGASGLCSGTYNAGGGSSFISGHTGCNAIDANGNHTGGPNHYSGYIFTNTEMQTGIREGNGLVTITYIP